VILLRKPSDSRIRRFLDEQRSLPFSYPEVGASREGTPPGYPVNHHRGRLGAGPEAFALAARALRSWKMYETGWTRLCWPNAPVAEGTVVGVLSRQFGLWSLNACQIVYVLEEEGPSRAERGLGGEQDTLRSRMGGRTNQAVLCKGSTGRIRRANR
jgi:uncharacterized protein (UPF0548 family)